MKTILDVINLGEDFLKKKGIERARREAEELIADALAFRRIDLYLNYDRPLNEGELDTCRTFFARRAKKEPPQYISGKLSFAGVTIKVDPKVLIPRPETELLVEKMKKELKAFPTLQGKVLWDMCTGSGCIGIALKKAIPELEVVLSDISHEALERAHENAALNDVTVTLCQGDLFAPMEGRKIDFFVANPPYVSTKEFEVLAPEVRLYEPKLALLGGESGLDYYEKIALKLFSHLKEGGIAALEIGRDQKEGVSPLFQKDNWHISVEKDWAGHDRFFFLRKS